MKRTLYIILSLLLVSLAACKKDSDKKVDLGYLDVVSSNTQFNCKGGEGEIVVNASSQVTAELENYDWCMVDKISGNTVYIKVALNTAIDSRSTYITISADGRSRRVPIVQLGLDFTLDATTLDFTAAAGSKPVKFTVPEGVTVKGTTNQTWAKVTVNANTKTANVTVDANSGESRNATITLSSGNVKLDVAITQGNNFSIATDPVIFANTAASKTIPFTFIGTDIDVSVAVSGTDTSWLTTDVNNGTNILTLSAALNSAIPSRSATVTVTAGTATRVISVMQRGMPIAMTDVTGTYTGTFKDRRNNDGTFATVTIAAKDETTVTMTMHFSQEYESTNITDVTIKDIPPFDLTLNSVEQTLSCPNNHPLNSKWTASGGALLNKGDWSMEVISASGSAITIPITAIGTLKTTTQWGFYITDITMSDGSVGYPVYIFNEVTLTRQP